VKCVHTKWLTHVGGMETNYPNAPQSFAICISHILLLSVPPAHILENVIIIIIIIIIIIVVIIWA